MVSGSLRRKKVKWAGRGRSALPAENLAVDFHVPLGDDLGMIAFCDLARSLSGIRGTRIKPTDDAILEGVEIVVQFRTVNSAGDVHDAPEVSAEEFQLEVIS